MTGERRTDSVAEIEASLTRNATELWGAERAAAIESLIHEAAERIWRIAYDPPPPEDEPPVNF